MGRGRRSVEKAVPSRRPPAPEGRTLQDTAAFPHLEVLADVVAVAIGAVCVLGAEPGHHVEVAGLLLVAVAPWLLRWWLRAWSYWWSILVLGAVAVLQIGGPAAGWLGSDASGQASLALVLWLALDDAVSRPPVLSRVTAVLGATVVVARDLTDPIDSTLIWLGGLVVCHVGGTVLRTVALTVVRLREAEGQLARDALDAERRRVAREVHDVVAHSLSVTALHLSAARMANERGDAGATRDALSDAERLTRSSLADLRRTIGLLRASDEGQDPTEAAPPGLGDLAALVDSFTSAGMECALDGPDPLPAVDALTGLTLFRVTQEALTNAARHQVEATGRVTLRAAGDTFVLTVVTDGAPREDGPPGTGVIGMAERVESLGGTLTAGPAARGWRVEAHLPDRRPDGSVPVRSPSEPPIAAHPTP